MKSHRNKREGRSNTNTRTNNNSNANQIMEQGMREMALNIPPVGQNITVAMEESGDKERLKNYLRQRLIECGWREEMRDLAKEVIASRGVSNHNNGYANNNTTITQEDLVSELLPRGQALVPEQVRISFYDQLRALLHQYQSPETGGVKQREQSQI